MAFFLYVTLYAIFHCVARVLWSMIWCFVNKQSSFNSVVSIRTHRKMKR